MKTYELSIQDIQENYFHFTNEKNLKNIEMYGLIPVKGKHAKYIEETEKVFFVRGLDNLLILFDCWIHVYKKIPILPDSKITYGLGSKAMSSKYFPMFFVDLYFWFIKNSRRHKRYAYQTFTTLLNECVLLKLNLQEDIDFSLQDIDEIKARGYRKRHLIELGYSEKYSDMSSYKMDDWNLHTRSGRGVSVEQIQLCCFENSSSILDIFHYALEHTYLHLEEICPNLYDYLCYTNINKK